MLNGKQYIRQFSHRPEAIRKLDAEGIPLIDIVSASRHDPDLIKWVEFFRSKDVPVFALRGPDVRNKHMVHLWIKREVDPAEH